MPNVTLPVYFMKRVVAIIKIVSICSGLIHSIYTIMIITPSEMSTI